ncbi:MAG: SRPBCC domain-containing protein, partial [Bacteroidota bacterium]
GKVLEYIPGKTLSYTWRPDDFHDDWEDSIVSYHFAPDGKGTEVKLEHHKLPNIKETKDHEAGWEDQVFGPIREYLAHAIA